MYITYPFEVSLTPGPEYYLLVNRKVQKSRGHDTSLTSNIVSKKNVWPSHVGFIQQITEKFFSIWEWSWERWVILRVCESLVEQFENMFPHARRIILHNVNTRDITILCHAHTSTLIWKNRSESSVKWFEKMFPHTRHIILNRDWIRFRLWTVDFLHLVNALVQRNARDVCFENRAEKTSSNIFSHVFYSKSYSFYIDLQYILYIFKSWATVSRQFVIWETIPSRTTYSIA